MNFLKKIVRPAGLFVLVAAAMIGCTPATYDSASYGRTDGLQVEVDLTDTANTLATGIVNGLINGAIAPQSPPTVDYSTSLVTETAAASAECTVRGTSSDVDFSDFKKANVADESGAITGVKVTYFGTEIVDVTVDSASSKPETLRAAGISLGSDSTFDPGRATLSVTVPEGTAELEVTCQEGY